MIKVAPIIPSHASDPRRRGKDASRARGARPDKSPSGALHLSRRRDARRGYRAAAAANGARGRSWLATAPFSPDPRRCMFACNASPRRAPFRQGLGSPGSGVWRVGAGTAKDEVATLGLDGQWRGTGRSGALWEPDCIIGGWRSRVHSARRGGGSRWREGRGRAASVGRGAEFVGAAAVLRGDQGHAPSARVTRLSWRMESQPLLSEDGGSSVLYRRWGFVDDMRLLWHRVPVY